MDNIQAVEAAKRAAERQRQQERLRKKTVSQEKKERQAVVDTKKEKQQHAQKLDVKSDDYVKKYKSKKIHQEPRLYSHEYYHPHEHDRYHHEETQPKKKFTKKQIMGLNAEFAKKRKDDDCGCAHMAQNAYEDRNVIPFERAPAKQVEIGFDKDVEPSDTKKQLKRRKAIKIIKAYVKEAGVWGSSGGFAGLPDAGTQNTSQAGGISGKIGPDPEEKNYKLKKKSKISVPDAVVGGKNITPNS